MTYMRSIKRRGFSLIELLIVIVLLGIITGLILLSASSTSVVEAQTETRNMIRSLQSLRSGWLAFYADQHKLLGVPTSGDIDTYEHDTVLVKSMEIYLDRNIEEEMGKYGDLMIGSHTVSNVTSVYIGFAWNSTDESSINRRNDFAQIRSALEAGSRDYGLLNRSREYYRAANTNGIMIRVQ